MTPLPILRDLIAEYEHLSARQIAIALYAATEPRAQCTVRAMAAYLRVPKPVITRATDVLVAMGAARRVVDPLDRRSIFIELTRDGRKLVAPLAALVVGGKVAA